MDLNSVKGATAYETVPKATPAVDHTLLNQNREAAVTDPESESTQAVQEAFKVTLTKEAQDLLAAKTNEEPISAETTPSGNETGRTAGEAHELKQIVNIIS